MAQNKIIMMNPNNHKKSNRRNRKFHQIIFKLSAGQYHSLQKYCKARKTTPIKLIKKSIERFTSNYEYEVPAELYLTENQLQLFEDDKFTDTTQNKD